MKTTGNKESLRFTILNENSVSQSGYDSVKKLIRCLNGVHWSQSLSEKENYQRHSGHFVSHSLSVDPVYLAQLSLKGSSYFAQAIHYTLKFLLYWTKQWDHHFNIIFDVTISILMSSLVLDITVLNAPQFFIFPTAQVKNIKGKWFPRALINWF